MPGLGLIVYVGNILRATPVNTGELVKVRNKLRDSPGLHVSFSPFRYHLPSGLKGIKEKKKSKHRQLVPTTFLFKHEVEDNH